jgi:propionate CoA-transferase
VTYPARKGVVERGQKAMLITERAVFVVDAQGLLLTEVAPGIDVKTQVLELMDMGNVRVSPELRPMAPELFLKD